MNRTAKSGFTLVELICVIIVLSVLAAVALPKFVDMSTAARVAAVKGAYGAISSAAIFAGSQCQVTPGCFVDSQGGLVGGPDGLSNHMWNGYPTGLSRPTGGYLFYGIKDWVLVQGFTANELDYYTTDFTSDGARDPNNCKVSYTQASVFGAFPSIVTTTSGC